MSAPEDIVGAQLQALLERLSRDREHRCFAELTSGRERARAIERAARGDANRRMRDAVRYERRRLTEALALRRAELEAVQRREGHAALHELVTRASDALPAALERRWRELDTRRSWCEAALAVAARRIRASDWTIEIAAGASSEERAELLARASALRPGTHTLHELEQLRAGLCVRGTGATLDATITGLLDDLGAIQGRILHEWLHQQSRPVGEAASA